LNERHYGILQGVIKTEAKKIYGVENIHIWKSSYETGPPRVSENDSRHPKYNAVNEGISLNELPTGESMKMCVDRVKDIWLQKILPDMKAGENILIVAHNNVLRGLIKFLKQIPITECEKIPNGIP